MSAIAAALGQLLRPLFESLVQQLFTPTRDVSKVEAADARLESLMGSSDEDHDDLLLARASSLRRHGM